MTRKKLSLLLLLSVSLLPFNLYAQSGRKTEPKETKTEVVKSADEGLTESRIGPDGETVEGDTIKFDTSLVMVPEWCFWNQILKDMVLLTLYLKWMVRAANTFIKRPEAL